MSIKICFAYPWATLGGVERVLINRLIALQNACMPVEVDLIFLSDSGGIEPLRKIIKKLGLDANVVVATDFAEGVAYDIVFCIDCPQFIALCDSRNFRYIAECHTTYSGARQYLRSLPSSCKIIATPSRLFSENLRKELGKACKIEITELSNFVPLGIEDEFDAYQLPGWARKPILFFGRMDKHKNPLALLDSFAVLEKSNPGRFMCVFCGPRSIEINIDNEIAGRNQLSNVLILPPVTFSKSAALLKLVRDKNGIFVSPSIGESYGLSAAEAISAGLPVVLSDIDAHCALVMGHEDMFTYKLGDPCDLAGKILNVFDRYSVASEAIANMRAAFSEQIFIDDFIKLIKRIGVAYEK